MVGRDDDGLDALGLAHLVLDGDLRLAIRTEEGEPAVLSDLGELFGEPVGERDGQRHQLGRLAAGEADHHALVARPLELEGVGFARSLALLERVVHAGRDVRRLLLQIDLDERVVGVKADLLVVVADGADGVPDRALDVEVGVGRDLADDHAEALGDRRLAADPSPGILRQHAVEHRVRDRVADLVGEALGD